MKKYLKAARAGAVAVAVGAVAVGGTAWATSTAPPNGLDVCVPARGSVTVAQNGACAQGQLVTVANLDGVRALDERLGRLEVKFAPTLELTLLGPNPERPTGHLWRVVGAGLRAPGRVHWEIQESDGRWRARGDTYDVASDGTIDETFASDDFGCMGFVGARARAEGWFLPVVSAPVPLTC